MSVVGKFFFSKLVLPAIAVQAKEADIDEGHSNHVAPVASVPVNPMYGPGNPRDHMMSSTAMAAAPAFASRRNLSLARYRSAAPGIAPSNDALFNELLAFRQWQASQGGGSSPGGSITTPVNRGTSSASPHFYSGGQPSGLMRGPSPAGTTNIIVVNNSSSEYRPSNLGTTRDPGYSSMQGAPEVTMLHLPEQMGPIGSGGLHQQEAPAGVPVVDLDAIKEEDELRKDYDDSNNNSNDLNKSLKLDVDGSPSHTITNASGTTAVIQPNTSAPTPTAMNTVEQTKIVPVIEDGKLVNKQVAHNVTYTNDQLYTAATQFYHRLLAEAIGTWALVFFIAGVNIEASLGHIDQMGVAIASGLVFVFLIYSLGQVSGAHFNPIVTYAFVLRGMFPLTWLPFYWVVQFVGALVGAAMLLGFYGAPVGDAGATIVTNYSPRAAFLMEAVLCFVLVFAILSMASRAKIVGPHAALAIGAVIAFNVFLAGSYSGASMNPWRSVCVSLVFPVTFYSIWVYFAGPFLGATIAVIAVFALAGKPRSDELTAGIGATIAVAIGNSISRDVEKGEGDDDGAGKVV